MIVSSTRRRADNETSIAVIGGGFSGASVVYHLARAATSRLNIVLFEPRARVGYGVAYSTPGEHLLLNVPACRMSLDPGRPTDFLDWCLTRGHQVEAAAFLPRSWFGDYTEVRMTDQITAAGAQVSFRRVRGRVEWIDEDGEGLRVVDTGGEVHRVDHAVLALGHGPTRVPDAIEPVIDAPMVLHSPWDEENMVQIAMRARRVLLVGTGLTMCDAAITLARLGFAGEMTAISRRGLLPRVHGESNPAMLAEWRDGLPTGSLRELRGAIRRAAHSHGWRTAIDALRSRTGELWSALSHDEQARFIHRLAPFWDVHRHRLPPECAAEIGVLREAGRLRVVRGQVRSVTRSTSWLRCELTSPGASRAETLHAEAIVLCTGPEPDPRRWGSPMIDGLIAHGLASPEANRLGLRTTNSGLLVGRDAVVRSRLSAIGPLRRGRLWESTAVPELSAQAAALGRLLTEQHAGPRSSMKPVTARPVARDTTSRRNT